MKKIFLPIIVILTLLTFTNISMAAIDAPNILNNSGLQSEASEAFNIAHKIFGNAWEIATIDNYNSNQYSSGIMASISEVLTLVALLLVSVLVAWTITTSSVDVASTGQSTASQYSGVWLPLRTALSVLFLVPMAGGYAMIRIIVLAVASWGMQAGDAVWQSSLDHLLKTPQEQVMQSESIFDNDEQANPYNPNPKIEPPTIKNHTKHLKKSPHSIFATHKTQTFF